MSNGSFTLIASPLFPLLVIAAGSPVLILSFWNFDKLLCLQRTAHEDAWIADGRPYPFFFRGGLSWPRTFRAQRASRRLPMVWLFRTPSWAESDSRARDLFRKLRILGAIWNLGVMPIYAVTLVVAAHADQQAHHRSPNTNRVEVGVPSAR